MAQDPVIVQGRDPSGLPVVLHLDANGRLHSDANIQVGDVDVSAANPVPVNDAGGSLSVDDAGGSLSVDDAGGTLSVDDAGGSLTVDQPAHDALNANVNLQVGDADVAIGNPVPIRPVDDCIVLTDQPAITAGIYAADDTLGGRMDLADAARVAGGTGRITKVVVIDDDQQMAPIDIVFFDRAFVATADNAPFDPTDADLENCIGSINVAATDYADFTDNSVATKRNVGFDFDLVAGGTILYAQMVVRNTPTYAAVNSLTVKLFVERR